MKRFLSISMTALMLTSPGTANAVDQATIDLVCPLYGDIARAYMTQRQNGASLTDMLAEADSVDTSLIPSAKELARMIILQAYEQPLYTTPHIIERVITQYENDVVLQCYQQLMGN